MKTKKLLIAACSLAMLALLPPTALASETNDDEGVVIRHGKDDKEKIKIVSKHISLLNSGSFLGVGVADIGEDRARTLDLKDEYGVEVKSVVPDSAAAKAGLKKRDVVLEFNGQKVEGTAQFIRMVRETPPGRQVRLQILRDGRTSTVTGTMGKRKASIWTWRSDDDAEGSEEAEAPETPETPETPEPFELDQDQIEKLEKLGRNWPHIVMPDIPSPLMSWNQPRLGVETETLGAQLAEFFGVKRGEGVLVRSVIKGSAAEKAGLKAGDVILKVGDEEIGRPGDLSSVLRSMKAGEGFPIAIVRNRRESTLTATLEERKPGTLGRRMRRPRAAAPTPPPAPDNDSDSNDDEPDEDSGDL